MIIDKLNADCLFDLIAAKGIDALGSIVQSVLSALRDAKIDELEAQLKENIVSKRRRFGKGATLLAPFGYFHPSEIISVVADNASRGRLLRNGDGCAYIYDFYSNGEIAAITSLRNRTKTICEQVGNVKTYLTYWIGADCSNEIVDVTLAKYADNGLLDTMIQVALMDNMKKVGEMNVEMNAPLTANQRICRMYTIVPANDSFKVFGCFPNAYRMFYDDKLKIIDWESLSEEKMTNITL